MVQRTPAETVSQIVADLRTNRGRRLGHAAAWRMRRVRNRLLSKGAYGPAVYSVSFGPNGERVMQTLRQHGSDYQVPAMFGASPRPSAGSVHIGVESVEAFCRCVLEQCADLTIYARAGNGEWRGLSVQAVGVAGDVGASFDLLVVERRIEAVRTHIQGSRIQVAVWREIPGAYGKTYRESDRQFGIVGRLRPPTFDSLAEEGHDFDTDFPSPERPSFPIDVVYTWVDGEDEAWQEQKARFSTEGSGSSLGEC